MHSLPTIPTPPSQRWQEFRVQAVPVIVFVGVICAVIPVVAYQGTLTLLAKSLESWMNNAALVDSINATGGMLVFCTSLIILEIKKVELANYLPSLIYAPLLTWWWR